MMDVTTRLPRLMAEYSAYPPESLKASVLKISKRLGGDKTKDAINAIESGDLARAIEITLFYYDRAYLFGLKKKSSKNIICINTDTDIIEINAYKILEAAKKEYAALPFTKRWLKMSNIKMETGLRQLVSTGALYPYAMLKEVSGKPVSQAEHTVIVGKKPIVTTRLS